MALPQNTWKAKAIMQLKFMHLSFSIWLKAFLKAKFPIFAYTKFNPTTHIN